MTFTREKIEKVLQIPPCELGGDLKSYLGVAVYFIDHIRDYATLVVPLHRMLKAYKRDRKLAWTEEGRVAFEAIKDAINNCTLLYFIDDISPIELYTDASDFGIGGYLCQIKDGKEYPIAFVSHGLSEQEIRWSTIEKECYAIVYSLLKLDYLLSNRKFLLKTDHANLTFLDADKNPKVKRWKLAVQGYDAEFEYIPGPSNVIADPLSRLGWKQAYTKNGLANALAALREVPHELQMLFHNHQQEQLNVMGLAPQQVREDPEHEHCLYALRQNKFYPKSAREFQISPHVRELIAKVHNSRVGHHGVDKTMQKLIALGHHWLYMREHVKYFIKRCCPFCQKMSYVKTPIHTNPFTTAAYAPFERQNWDSIGPITLQDGSTIHILCSICCFTRWTELWVIDHVSVDDTKVPVLQHFNRFGEPSQILTDNGTQFKNDTLKELFALIGIEHASPSVLQGGKCHRREEQPRGPTSPPSVHLRPEPSD